MIDQMKTGRQPLERTKGAAMTQRPRRVFIMLAALQQSRLPSKSTSRLVRPLTPPPQRNQSVYGLISKFERFSQMKTARERARAVLTEWRGRMSMAVDNGCSHISMRLSSCVVLAVTNQIQALTGTVNLVRGVASAMWAPQGHLKH